MSRKNRIEIVLLFWMGIALTIFALAVLFVPISASIMADNEDRGTVISCGTVGQILTSGHLRGLYADGTNNQGGEADVLFDANCMAKFHWWIGVAGGSLLSGAALVVGATVRARRIFRPDYKSVNPVVG